MAAHEDPPRLPPEDGDRWVAGPDTTAHLHRADTTPPDDPHPHGPQPPGHDPHARPQPLPDDPPGRPQALPDDPPGRPQALPDDPPGRPQVLPPGEPYTQAQAPPPDEPYAQPFPGPGAEPQGPPPVRPAAPSSKRTAARGRMSARARRSGRREPPGVWWAGFALWGLLAWFAESWRLALLGLAAWCLYEFLLIPTVCRVMTEQGYPCREPVRGRPFACGPDHQAFKNEGITRLLGIRRPAPRPARERERGRGVVHSPAVRARLAQADQACLIMAGTGTVVAIAGMIYGIAG